MRSFLLASLASLATQHVYGHPTHATRTLSRRVVDLSAFRQVLDSEYANATAVQSDPSIASLSKRADPVDTATELVKATVSHYRTYSTNTSSRALRFPVLRSVSSMITTLETMESRISISSKR